MKQYVWILFLCSWLMACVQPTPMASIGASIGVDKSGWLYLIHLSPDGPAASSKAILHGDRLVGIKASPEQPEFTMVHTLKREEVIDLIQGAYGSSLTLWLVRDFKSHYVTLKRTQIVEPAGP